MTTTRTMTGTTTTMPAATINTSIPGDYKRLWHVVAAVLLLALATAGCNKNGSSAPTPGPQPAPQPSNTMSELDRAPVPVREAFRKDPDREDAKVVSVKGRLMPDGLVRYEITSTDAKGARHVDVYRADGMKMSSK